MFIKIVFSALHHILLLSLPVIITEHDELPGCSFSITIVDSTPLAQAGVSSPNGCLFVWLGSVVSGFLKSHLSVRHCTPLHSTWAPHPFRPVSASRATEWNCASKQTHPFCPSSRCCWRLVVWTQTHPTSRTIGHWHSPTLTNTHIYTHTSLADVSMFYPCTFTALPVRNKF